MLALGLGSLGRGIRAMCFARLLPSLTGDGSLLACPLGLPFGLLHSLAGALQLFFGDPHTLPGDFRQQPRALERLRRFPCGGCLGRCSRCGSMGAITSADRCACGSLFGGSLPHAQSRVVAGGGQCHIMAARLPPRFLSTVFVNNPVHTGPRRGQSRCGGKGLHQHGQGLISLSGRARATLWR